MVSWHCITVRVMSGLSFYNRSVMTLHYTIRHGFSCLCDSSVMMLHYTIRHGFSWSLWQQCHDAALHYQTWVFLVFVTAVSWRCIVLSDMFFFCIVTAVSWRCITLSDMGFLGVCDSSVMTLHYTIRHGISWSCDRSVMMLHYTIRHGISCLCDSSVMTLHYTIRHRFSWSLRQQCHDAALHYQTWVFLVFATAVSWRCITLSDMGFLGFCDSSVMTLHYTIRHGFSWFLWEQCHDAALHYQTWVFLVFATAVSCNALHYQT